MEEILKMEFEFPFILRALALRDGFTSIYIYFMQKKRSKQII